MSDNLFTTHFLVNPAHFLKTIAEVCSNLFAQNFQLWKLLLKVVLWFMHQLSLVWHTSKEVLKGKNCGGWVSCKRFLLLCPCFHAKVDSNNDKLCMPHLHLQQGHATFGAFWSRGILVGPAFEDCFTCFWISILCNDIFVLDIVY